MAFFVDAFAEQFALFVGGFEGGSHLLAALGELIENFFAAHVVFFAGKLETTFVEFVLLFFDGLDGFLGGRFAFGKLGSAQINLLDGAPGDEDGG